MKKFLRGMTAGRNMMLMLRVGVLLVDGVLSSEGVVVLSRESRPWSLALGADDGDCMTMPLEKPSVPTSLPSQTRWNLLQ